MTITIMADCCYAVSFMLSVTYKPFMLSVVVLNVVVPPYCVMTAKAAKAITVTVTGLSMKKLCMCKKHLLVMYILDSYEVK